VADSSSDENKKLNQKIISSISNIDIKYLVDYPTEIHPYHKFTHAMSLVNTEYYVFCADDDFIAPIGIEQSLDFLGKNHDFIVAHGKYFVYYLEDDDVDGKRISWDTAFSDQSILFPEAQDRLKHYISNYLHPSLYGVHRSEPLVTVFKETVKSEIDLSIFWELPDSMLTAIYGKIKCLDVFYAARNSNTATAGYLSTPKTAITEGIYDREFAIFRDYIATHLTRESQLSIEESMKLIDSTMSSYLKKYYFSRNKMAPLTTKAGLFLDRLNLPGWLNRGIRKSYMRLTRAEYIEKEPIDISPSSPYYEELNRINHLVLSSLEMLVE